MLHLESLMLPLLGAAVFHYPCAKSGCLSAHFLFAREPEELDLEPSAQWVCGKGALMG